MTKYDTLVRPFITLAFVLAQIALAIMWANGIAGAEQAFAALGAFTMMAVTFWFKSRDDERRGGDG